MEPMPIESTTGRWARHSVRLLPYLPAAIYALVPKWLQLRDHGFLVAARAAGYVVPNDRWQDTLGWIDRVAFFRSDLLLDFLVLPIVLLLATAPLQPRRRVPVIAAFSALVVAFVFADSLAFSNVGRYLSLPMALDALHWASANPQYLSAYVGLASLAKLALLLSLVAGLAFVAQRCSLAPPRPTLARHGLLLGGSLLLLPAFTAGAGAWTRVPATSLHRPVLQEMVAGFVNHGGGNDAFARLPANQLRALFADESHTRASPADPRYVAKASGYDVVTFVFETGPSRSLDITGSLADFPNLRRLRHHSLVAAAHHSTYPYTNRAIWSILSGTYPIDALDNYFWSDRVPAIPSWPRALHDEGYNTASYAPGHSEFTPDHAMLRALGIAEEHVSNNTPLRAGKAWQQTFVRDRESLKAMLGDMDRWLRERRRFAVVFTPQVGHGPWVDLRGNGDDWPARGRALMALQDQWLGEIMALLERHHRLARTIIVVTADHGVRTRSEDPHFTGGMIDDYSFHVPLLIWAPAAFPRTLVVRHVTSHIDLAPTLLDLIGSHADRAPFQGMDLWDPAIAARRTYFFGRGYLGADGFCGGQECYMTNYLFGAVYGAPRLAFDSADLLPANSAGAHRAMDELARMEAIRNAWFERIFDGSMQAPK